MEWDFQRILADLPAVLYRGYADGSMELFDRKAEALTGYSKEDFESRRLRWTDLIVEEDRGPRRQTLLQALKGGGTYTHEYRIRTAGGGTAWIHEQSHVALGADGRIASFEGLFFDITDRKQLETTVAERTAELQQANERLLTWGRALEHRNTEINLLGQMGDLLQCCNTTTEAHTGIQAFGGRLFPGDFGALYTYGDDGRVLEAAALWGERPTGEQEFGPEDCWALRRGRPHGRAEIEAGLRCRHLADRGAAYLCVPMAAHGSSLGVLHLQLADSAPEAWDARHRLAVEVAEHLSLALAKLKLQETLQQLSVRDPLTGLFNRRYLEESLLRELRTAERRNQPMGLLMVDLDHFKQVNDRHGHDAGDAVLRALGALLQKATRGGDIVCRFGGEEFAVLMPDTHKPSAVRRAEELRRAAGALRLPHGDGTLDPVTLSVGVAGFPGDGRTPEALFRAADAALYRAKEAGRDRVCEAG